MEDSEQMVRITDGKLNHFIRRSDIRAIRGMPEGGSALYVRQAPGGLPDTPFLVLKDDPLYLAKQLGLWSF
ncbi:hypothetical protein [Cupriavidus nantongensis]|uniref:Uncharacterized protein n=1 Tax=Cupriavidus nantongensis TaxID=1796606 RepID=A0A142JIS9_9BURK|nr:hypothetical protein [Cupriavidus nantongensis]AMR77991.1 hypothetical protein A2G96_09695 [Cupriavidus nantongensis]